MNRILWWLISILLVVGSLFWSWVTGVGCPGGPDGPYETYYENGQLEDRGIIKGGCLDGPSEVYYENGQLRSKTTWKVGVQVGGAWEGVSRGR